MEQSSTLVLTFAGGVTANISLPKVLMTDVAAYLGDVLPLSARPSSDARPAITVRHAEHLSKTGLRVMEAGILAGPGAMLDQNQHVHVTRQKNGTLEILSTTIPTEWVIWLLQLKLLESEATFVHCAGVEHAGRAILFPSWGGVGKTAIAKGFVQDEGWRLLGDDFVIMGIDGTCHAFPKSMVLYPYHRSLFPGVFDVGRGPVAPTAANDLLTRLVPLVKPALRRIPSALAWARRHNPQSVRIPPSQVFGESAIASEASVGAVVWLDRDAAITEPVIQPADETFFSRLAGSSMSEFDRRCVGLTPMMAGLGIVSFSATLGAWMQILEQSLHDADRWMIKLPSAMPVNEVPEAVKALLGSVGLFERRG